MFTMARAARWTGSRALQPLACPWCGSHLTRHNIWTQPPLFSHGGYGAATQIDTRTCDCGATSVTSTISVTPRPFRW